MNKSVVVITHNMIPHSNSWGGCQRIYYLSCYLQEKGYDVTVFSCYQDALNTFNNTIPFKTKAIKVKNMIVRRFLLSNQNNGQILSATEKEVKSTANSFVVRLKKNKLIRNLLRTVDDFIYNEPSSFTGPLSRSWRSASRNEIIQYVIKNEVKNIVISAPPFGIFSISKDIRKRLKNNVNIIFDYRDPWNLWDGGSVVSRSMEKSFLRFADRIVCTNEYLAADMAKSFRIPESKFLTVANGYSEASWKLISSKKTCNEKMVITYVGTISLHHESSYRNVTELFNAFERILKECKHIELRFVGIVNSESKDVNEARERFKDFIQIVGVVSNEESLEHMIVSDVLLLLHTTEDSSSKYIVSGKMYDYIKANKPIFSIGNKDGIHCRMIQENNLGIHSENKKEDLYRCLLQLYDEWSESNLSTFTRNSDTYTYSREYQNEKYLKLLK